MAATPKKPSFTEAFPACSAIIGEFRAAFGAAVQPTYCEEGGASVGKPLDESRYTVIKGQDLVITQKKGAAHGR